MSVNWVNKSSGNRESADPPVPTSGASQPILRTQTDPGVPANVHFMAENFTNKKHEEQRTPDFMPTGAVIYGPNGDSPGIDSTDITQPDIRGIGYNPAQGEGTVFKGAPNLGTSLVPEGRGEDGASF